MITSLEHVAIVADDPRALADWYCTALGCEIAIADETYSTYFVAVPGTGVLEILPLQRPSPHGSRRGRRRHTAHRLHRDRFRRGLSAHQGAGHRTPATHLREFDGTKLAFFPDLEGNILQFVYRPKPLR